MAPMSRQALHLRRSSLETIRADIGELPLLTDDVGPGRGFRIRSMDGAVLLVARYEVIRAFVAGYRAGAAPGAAVRALLREWDEARAAFERCPFGELEHYARRLGEAANAVRDLVAPG